MKDGEAEISMAVTTGLSSDEDRTAETIAKALLEKGLVGRTVWSKSDEDGRIELKIAGIRGGRSHECRNPDVRRHPSDLRVEPVGADDRRGFALLSCQRRRGPAGALDQ